MLRYGSGAASPAHGIKQALGFRRRADLGRCLGAEAVSAEDAAICCDLG
ncbi:hypothetical protein PR003_g20957 [Phytophthora rubi]|uniref:Uncharacterized protein n=1 Tax=Phytophthora rubi TaxID=129364 RepID=A0A6A4DL56_9STRA|nr:hypothetical protein PR003_g20957 [Phytophthora rubi]